MEELTQQERRELRQARFGGGKSAIPGMKEAATTVEALQLIEEQKRKKKVYEDHLRILNLTPSEPS